MQVLGPVMEQLESHKDWSMLSQDAGKVAEEVLKPLFRLLRHSAAHSRHGQIVPKPPEAIGRVQCQPGSCSAL